MAVFTLDKYSTACACAREKCSDDCSFYREYRQKLKPLTNYYRLRAKNVEEMADWLVMNGDGSDYKTWLDWLKQEEDDAD